MMRATQCALESKIIHVTIRDKNIAEGVKEQAVVKDAIVEIEKKK